MLKRMPSVAGQIFLVCLAIAASAAAVMGLAAITDRSTKDDATLIEIGGEAEPADLYAFRERCERLDRTGALARILYEADRRMQLGTSSVVRAAVTLNHSAPRDKLLRRPAAAEESGVVVSCSLQARLNASSYEFELSESDWVRRSLLSSNTARWSWHVKPKVGGSHALVLQLRPIVTAKLAGEITTDEASAEDANVQEYETTVDVSVPWDERFNELMTRLGATFKVGAKTATALTGLVAALLALAAAVGIKRRRASS